MRRAILAICLAGVARCYAEEPQPIARPTTHVVANVEEPCPPMRMASPALESDELRLESLPSIGVAVWIRVTTRGDVHTIHAMRVTPPRACTQQRLEVDRTRVLSAHEWQQLNHTLDLAQLGSLKPESLEQQMTRADGTMWIVYARGSRVERFDLHDEPFRLLCLLLIGYAGPDFSETVGGSN